MSFAEMGSVFADFEQFNPGQPRECPIKVDRLNNIFKVTTGLQVFTQCRQAKVPWDLTDTIQAAYTSIGMDAVSSRDPTPKENEIPKTTYPYPTPAPAIGGCPGLPADAKPFGCCPSPNELVAKDDEAGSNCTASGSSSA